MIQGTIVGAAVLPARGVLFNIQDMRGEEWGIRVVRTEQSMMAKLGDLVRLDAGQFLWQAKNQLTWYSLTRMYIDDAASVGPESLR